MSTVRVFEQAATASGTWQDYRINWSKILQTEQLPTACFLFDSSQHFSTPGNLRQSISNRFRIPSYLFSDVCSDLNGFFWCNDTESEDGNIEGHNICYRVMVKHAGQDIKAPNSYVWHEMGFFTNQLDASHTVVLCLNTPPMFQERLLVALRQSTGSCGYANPYFLQILLIDEIINLYDESVWGIRDHIRNVEKARLYIRSPEPDYFMLHEIARHAIHSVETLHVAVDTITALHNAYKSSLEHEEKPRFTEKPSSRSIQSRMQFQVQVLRNLWSRSRANEKRIHNEISYAYNSVAQRDSQIMVKVGAASRSDSAVMRTVALVTMTFFPATFLAALFSMSFFDFRPATDAYPETWSVSSKIWIYWAFVVPLTGLTLGTWFVWQRLSKRFDG